MDFTATLKQAGNVLKTSKFWIELLIMTVGMMVTALQFIISLFRAS